MASALLENLSAASTLAASDLFYVKQAGARGLKATGTQLLTLVGTTYVPLAGGTMTGALTLPAGAVGAPSLMFTGSGATTGIYSLGANDVSIAVGGARIAYAYSDSFWAAGASGFGILSDTAALYFGGSANCILRRDAAATLAQRNGTNAQTLRIYGTADGSPGSNYQRLVLSANGTTGVTIAAEGLGTPGTNQSITLTPGGAGDVIFPSATRVNASGYFFGPGALYNTASSINYYASGVRSNSAAEYAWTSGVVGGSVDTALFRNAAGIVEVTNGTVNTYRDLKLRNLLNVEYHQMTEMTAPAAPATNSVRIYAEDNGSGKTRLMALFATGSAVQLGIEP